MEKYEKTEEIFDGGRKTIEYKRKITELVEKIENPEILKRIYQLTEYLYVHKKKRSR